MRTDMKSEKNDTYINDKQMTKKCKKNAKQNAKKMQKNDKADPKWQTQMQKNDKIIILEFPMFAGPRFS